ncbi:hypothetical protein Csa_023981, partial [Cucumis sativus]
KAQRLGRCLILLSVSSIFCTTFKLTNSRTWRIKPRSQLKESCG